MSNPFNTLNPYNTNNINGIKNAYQMLMQSKDPMQMFQQLAMQNPQLQPILQMLKQGVNPQQIFYEMCKQRGLDPNAFIKSITG